jgi:hypothetical protein
MRSDALCADAPAILDKPDNPLDQLLAQADQVSDDLIREVLVALRDSPDSWSSDGTS